MRGLKRWLLIGVLVAVVVGVVLWRSQFTTLVPGVKPDLDAIEAMTTFDNSDWAHVLETYVDDQGQVNYAALKANPERLYRYVHLIGHAGPTRKPKLFPTSGHMLAYYINAYNALTMYNVIERWPDIKSVRDDRANFFVFTRFVVDGEDVSLHVLETKSVFKKFKQVKGIEKAHFALNCASKGCPRLPRVPFDGEAIEMQLDTEARKFLQEPRNYALDEDAVVVSQIFQWYEEQFRPDVQTWIKAEVPEVRLPEGLKLRHLPYDWSLNVQPR
ncbi:MAG: DUF547 domain-containing protein [Bradymonadia bacterium]